jgi:hypothetical protein
MLMQYVKVRDLTDGVQLNNDDDVVAWRWCSSGHFSSSFAYEAMFIGQSRMQGQAAMETLCANGVQVLSLVSFPR